MSNVISVCFVFVFCFSGICTAQTQISQDSIPRTNPQNSYSYEVDSLWKLYLDNHRSVFSSHEHIDSLEIIRSVHDSIYENRFELLNSYTPFNLSYNPAVEKYINEYLRYSGHMRKMMGLAEYYFPLMEKILDEYNMPLELKYLSVIESALNPEARSPVGASGLWQFMLPTGRECGLQINSYVDERYDPRKSTEAACVYLNSLFDIYGNWELAISAYNCGPGNVNKAIRNAKGSHNYWEIRPYLPRETQKYVPRFMSMVYLLNFGLEHNIKPDVAEFSYWQVDTVMLKNEMRFDQIVANTTITEAELKLLNPVYKRGLIPADYDEMKLVLPVEKLNQIEDNLSEILAFNPTKKVTYVAQEKLPDSNYSRPNGKRVTYKVRSGDVLGTIAEKHGVSVSQLKSWNRIRGTRIKAGQSLTIYVNKKAVIKEEQKPDVQTFNGDYEIYTVKKGDTLWDIAKLYPGVSADNIAGWNTHVNPKNLKSGAQLKIRK